MHRLQIKDRDPVHEFPLRFNRLVEIVHNLKKELEELKSKGGESMPVYEVVFTDNEKKKGERIAAGPTQVTASTERSAIVKAVLEEKAKLAKADLLTLDVKVRQF